MRTSTTHTSRNPSPAALSIAVAVLAPLTALDLRGRRRHDGACRFCSLRARRC